MITQATPEVESVKYGPSIGHQAKVEGNWINITRAQYFQLLAGQDVDLSDQLLANDEDYADWTASTQTGIPMF